jgi:hypothetical protein
MRAEAFMQHYKLESEQMQKELTDLQLLCRHELMQELFGDASALAQVNDGQIVKLVAFRQKSK